MGIIGVKNQKETGAYQDCCDINEKPSFRNNEKPSRIYNILSRINEKNPRNNEVLYRITENHSPNNEN